MAETNGMPNSTGSNSENYPPNYDRILTEVFTFVGLMAIFTNSLLVFTILKFNKLRNDVSNLLFVHLNIVQVIFFLATPLTIRINLTFHWFFYGISHTVFCSLYQAECGLGCAVILILILLILDGHLKLYHNELYKKFCRVYKFFVGLIYILVICIASLGISVCVEGYMYYHVFLILFIVASFILFLIIMNIVHLVKKRKLTNSNISTNLGLVISNIFFILWIPVVLGFIFEIFYQFQTPLILILLFTLGFSSPIFNFFYVFKYHSDFYIFLRQVFKCQCNNYSNETLIEDPVSYNGNNGVTISVK